MVKYTDNNNDIFDIMYNGFAEFFHALKAIEARINGEFDSPYLKAFGELTIGSSTETDCLAIAQNALVKFESMLK